MEVKISKSMLQFTDRAVIKLPITARIKRAGEVITESVETAKQFSEGDAVQIDLGYNGSLKTEFIGFISRINFTAPLEVECEGYSYQLRKRTYTKTFVKTSLLDVLKFLVQGTDIVLDEKQIPGFPIEKFMMDGESGTEALEKLKKLTDNTLSIIFTGNVLYAGLLGLDYKNLKNFPEKPGVTYRLGWNVIKDNNLKLREAKNQDVIVNYIGEKKDGTKEKVTANGKTRTREKVVKTTAAAGTSGETKTFKSQTINDRGSLQQMAEAKQLQLSYDGYEGKITAFLQPYCEPAYRAALEDKKYPERSGNYLVESVEVTYSTAGARRIVGIGLKL